MREKRAEMQERLIMGELEATCESRLTREQLIMGEFEARCALMLREHASDGELDGRA